jgi:hypothetical protein
MWPTALSRRTGKDPNGTKQNAKTPDEKPVFHQIVPAALAHRQEDNPEED